jgi:hypothetical protein
MMFCNDFSFVKHSVDAFTTFATEVFNTDCGVKYPWFAGDWKLAEVANLSVLIQGNGPSRLGNPGWFRRKGYTIFLLPQCSLEHWVDRGLVLGGGFNGSLCLQAPNRHPAHSH